MRLILTVAKEDKEVKLLRNTMIVGRVGDIADRTFDIDVRQEGGAKFPLDQYTPRFEGITGKGRRVVILEGFTALTTGGTMKFTPPTAFFSNSGYYKNAYFHFVPKDGKAKAFSTNDFEVKILSNAMVATENVTDYIDGMQEIIQGIVDATNEKLTQEMAGINKDIAKVNADIKQANIDLIDINKRVYDQDQAVKQLNYRIGQETIRLDNSVKDINTRITTESKRIDTEITAKSAQFDKTINDKSVAFDKTIDTKSKGFDATIKAKSDAFDKDIKTKTDALDVRIVELNKKLDDIAAEVGAINALTEAKMYALIDPLDKGYRWYDKVNTFTRILSGTVDLLEIKSTDWAVVNAHSNGIEGTAQSGFLFRAFGNSGFGYVQWIPSSSNGTMYCNYRSGNSWTGWKKQIHDTELSQLLFGTSRVEQIDVVDFRGKVRTSTEVNPHIADNISSVTIVPTTRYSELTQPSYDQLKFDNDTVFANSSSVDGNSLWVPLWFNMVEQVRRDFPMLKDEEISKVISLISEIRFTGYAKGTGTINNTSGNRVELHRQSKATNTYVPVTANTLASIAPLSEKWTKAGGLSDLITDDGFARFTLKAPPASTGVGSRLDIRYVKVEYKIEMPSLMQHLDDLRNGYRWYSSDTGNIPQNPTGVSKDLLLKSQGSFDWVYLNSVTSQPAGVGNSGFAKRVKVGDNITEVRWRAFGDTAEYKSMRLNKDEWSGWLPCDQDGFGLNNVMESITELPARPHGMRYVSLAPAISPLNAQTTGVLSVGGVLSRMVAVFVDMLGGTHTAVYSGNPAKWGSWSTLQPSNYNELATNTNLNNLIKYPLQEASYICKTDGIAAGILSKPADLPATMGFSIKMIPVRDASPVDYMYRQELITRSDFNTGKQGRVFSRFIGMSTVFRTSEWVEDTSTQGTFPINAGTNLTQAIQNLSLGTTNINIVPKTTNTGGLPDAYQYAGYVNKLSANWGEGMVFSTGVNGGQYFLHLRNNVLSFDPIGGSKFPIDTVIEPKTATGANIMSGNATVLSEKQAIVNMRVRLNTKAKGEVILATIDKALVGGYSFDPSYQDLTFTLQYDNKNFGKSVSVGTITTTGVNYQFKFSITDEIIANFASAANPMVMFTANVPIS